MGNKIDLIEKEEVKEEEVKDVAKNLNAIFMKTSAKAPENIDKLFNLIGEKLLNKIEDDTKLNGENLQSKIEVDTKLSNNIEKKCKCFECF